VSDLVLKICTGMRSIAALLVRRYLYAKRKFMSSASEDYFPVQNINICYGRIHPLSPFLSSVRRAFLADTSDHTARKP
jgi:hypothetical protein